MSTVSDASPLIALFAIGREDLLSALFGTVLIPPGVDSEISPSISLRPEWLRVQPLRLPQSPPIAASGLGSGERQALSLGLELGAYVILDDRPARRLAHALGIRTVGTLGVLLAAKRRGALDRVRPLLDQLHKQRFFMGQQLREQVLQLAGEGTDAP